MEIIAENTDRDTEPPQSFLYLETNVVNSTSRRKALEAKSSKKLKCWFSSMQGINHKI